MRGRLPIGRLPILTATAVIVLLSAGSASAATVNGDFDGNGKADLAIGAPGEEPLVDNVNVNNGGGVNVLYGGRNGLSGKTDDFWTQKTRGIRETPEEQDKFGLALATGDFNRDGFSDLAIGAPGESMPPGDPFAVEEAGAVHVLFGGSKGLSARGDLLLDSAALGLDRVPEAGFGASLAAANFGDGKRDDLAIGAPERTDGDDQLQGAVVITPGRRSGFRSEGTSIYFGHPDGDGSEELDLFGWTLAAANFGGSPEADLAIGAPGETLDDGEPDEVQLAGVVGVLEGSPEGISEAGRVIDQSDSGGALEDNDAFGASLAAANFGGSAEADLAIGAPFEDPGADPANAGSAHVMYGSATGIVNSGSAFFTQQNLDTAEVPEAGEQLGGALAAADFGEGPEADLAVAIPRNDVVTAGGPRDDAGSVGVLYGSAAGLTAPGPGLFEQRHLGGTTEGDEHFGSSLAAGNFGSGGAPDLAVGVPFEAHEAAGVVEAGEVDVLYGDGDALALTGNDSWVQGEDGIRGAAADFDEFGTSLAPPAGRDQFDFPF